ncbi:MAG: 4Fe-4S binding protein [Candidatus Woesearchaeota archaeon]
MKKMHIAHKRIIVQVLAFLILIFGGFVITTNHLGSDILPFIKPPATGSVKPSYITPRTNYSEVFDTYLPVRTCRYLGSDTRIFRACSIHFFTEVPIYGVPLRDFLPHFFFFVLLAFLFSRLMCGWICPLGAIQDFLNWIRNKVGLSRWRLPKRFYKFFEKFRYIWLAFLFIMAVAIVIPALGLVPLQRDLNILSCNTCPGRTVFPIITGDMPGLWFFGNPLHFAIGLLGISFLTLFSLSFFGKRLWCKMCPNGAILSLFNKGSAITKEKDNLKCTKCGICERVCPMDNPKVLKEKNKKIVNDYNCINCYRCVDKCPEDNCLKVKFFKWTIFWSRYCKNDKKDSKPIE